MILLALTPQQVCVCQPKPSGNTLAEAEQQLRSTACLATPTARTMTVCLETLRGTREIMEHQVHQPMEQSPLPAKPQMRLACTTCQPMYRSGAMIGMKVRITAQAHLWTQQGLRQMCSTCCAAAGGAAAPTAAARRAVASAHPTTAAAASASVSRGLRSSLYPLLIPWNQLLFYLYHFTLYRANAPQFLRNLEHRHISAPCQTGLASCGASARSPTSLRHHDSKVVALLNKTRMGV